ncbi:MAG TPA: bifunctional (p)ppGpp synthetase/guanosine-3',5'-bis(diphosphate) 3'-pyrophosphohydrolase [Myxococcales bacterium]|nr:bifunctional (p)ppGpp synthetase/guanosine-3',5'-bis(diphosphate) 3'-pyrophosphohydrolase [Myxococcales bacterium]
MIRLNDILEKVSAYHADADLDLIKKAYVYSAKVHQGQVRKSGEPYLVHPLEVAGILADLKLDEASIVAGLLHDTIEDTLAKPEEIKEIFGVEVLELVEGVTKLGALQSQQNASFEEKQAENFRKMLVAMAKDIRVILVKLADRTHNMRTLEHMKPESQQRIAQETQDIYAPLANRLGIQWIKIELEDLAFKYLKPNDFADTEKQLEQTQKDRQKYILDVVELLKTKLREAGLEAEVQGRPKHVYSIWKKMRKNGLASVTQLHDIVAFRLILKSVPACYEALGLIHSLWKPVPGRFKDYVAIPKPNMYQSLHTTVIGPNGERIEIQMRTEEMHRIAEEGIAAHWAYKEGKSGKDEQKFAWLRQLMEWQQDLKDPREFLETVKVDLFQDEVFVFTPRGDVKSLPSGSTPVDLAYSVHSDVGAHCVGAKVNGKMVPLRYKLKNGDSVEILTGNNAKPNKDWLSFVKTPRAQARIRAFIKNTQRERSIDIGKDLLEREFKRFNLNFSKIAKGADFLKAANEMGHSRPDDLVSAVGYGKLSPTNVLQKIFPPERLTDRLPSEVEAADGSGNRLAELFRRVAQRNRTSGGVRIGGVDDVLVRYGKCCAPVPGDPIVGFITRGRGVTVHVRGCKKAMETDPERRVDVAWDVHGEFKRVVNLRVRSDDRKGLLAAMSETFAEVGVNIIQANARAGGDQGAVSTFEVEIADVKQLNEVLRAIGTIPGVHSVERV